MTYEELTQKLYNDLSGRLPIPEPEIITQIHEVSVFDTIPSTIWFAIKILILMGILSWLSSCIIIVKQKSAKIVEVFGKFSSIKKAGLNFKAPWPIGLVAGDKTLQIQEIGEHVGAKSKDNAFLAIPVKVQFQVIEESIKEAYYELTYPHGQIVSYITNIVRSKANEMDMDEIFKSKDAFETAVAESLNETFAKYGYKIVNVLVDDPQPSEELKESFDRVLAAKRDQEASLFEKEAIKNRTVGKAQAEAESLVLKSEAYVKMRNILAEGNSKAIKKFVENLEVSDIQALKYFEGLDARDAIRDASEGEGSVIIVPSGGMSSNVSEIAAITEALKSDSI